MRSPGPAPPAVDGGDTMVNCAVKSEGKKESCHEAPQGSAAAEPQPGDPARAPHDGADTQAPAQVPRVGVPSAQGPRCTRAPPPTPSGHPPPSWVESRQKWSPRGQDLGEWGGAATGQATCVSGMGTPSGMRSPTSSEGQDLRAQFGLRVTSRLFHTSSEDQPYCRSRR